MQLTTHSTFFAVPAAASLMVYLLWRLLPRRRDYLQECEKLTARLVPRRLDELHAVIQADGDPVEDTFWNVSHGLYGLRQRAADMLVLVRLLQVTVRHGGVCKSDAWYVWRQAMVQFWYTFWAIPEAALCRLWRDLPHVCALSAARFHYRASLRTKFLCDIPGAPGCVVNGGKLL